MLTHRGQQVYQAFKLLFICQYLQALCLYQENLIEEEAEAKGKTASRAKNSDLGFYIEGGTTENWRCIEENREVFSGLAPEFPVRKNDAVSKQYIYGNGIDDIVRMDVFSGSTGTPYYFHQDHIGNVTAITDGSGNVVERVSYDLYGKPTFTDGSGSALTQSSIGNTLLFQSREYDGETSLYHFRARAYDPFMGRFLQTDPLGYVDSMNLYQAFNMNPFNFTDPMGKEYFVFSQQNGQSLVSIWQNRAAWQNGDPALFSDSTIDSLPDEYKNMVVNNNLQQRSQQDIRRVEFTDRPGGGFEPVNTSSPGNWDQNTLGTGYNAVAKVTAGYGNNQVEYKEFDARTIPSDPTAHSKIQNGEYIGVWWQHQGLYNAMQLRYGIKSNNSIPILGPNIAHPNQAVEFPLLGISIGYMQGINVHKSGSNPMDGTGFFGSGPTYISQGCLLLRRSKWNEFYSILNINQAQYGENGTKTVQVILDTSANN